MIPSSATDRHRDTQLRPVNAGDSARATVLTTAALRSDAAPASGRAGGIVPIRAADRSRGGTLPPKLRKPPAGLEPEIDAPPSRLLSIADAARYLSLSWSSVYEFVVNGILPAVRLPAPRARDGRMLRRILIDRSDLDALISKWKERSA